MINSFICIIILVIETTQRPRLTQNGSMMQLFKLPKMFKIPFEDLEFESKMIGEGNVWGVIIQLYIKAWFLMTQKWLQLYHYNYSPGTRSNINIGDLKWMSIASSKNLVNVSTAPTHGNAAYHELFLNRYQISPYWIDNKVKFLYLLTMSTSSCHPAYKKLLIIKI